MSRKRGKIETIAYFDGDPMSHKVDLTRDSSRSPDDSEDQNRFIKDFWPLLQIHIGLEM